MCFGACCLVTGQGTNSQGDQSDNYYVWVCTCVGVHVCVCACMCAHEYVCTHVECHVHIYYGSAGLANFNVSFTRPVCSSISQYCTCTQPTDGTMTHTVGGAN